MRGLQYSLQMIMNLNIYSSGKFYGSAHLLIAHAHKPPLNAHADISRGARSPMFGMCGTGCPDPPPPGNSQNYRGYSNIGVDPFKIAKLPSQHSMLGHNRHASKTPFKNRVSLAV